MKSVKVESKVRKLGTTWTRELVYDLENFTGIDFDELDSVLEKELRKEKRKNSINKIFKK